MALYYLRSGAAGAATGADWANAFTTLSAATGAAGGGDTIYVAADHAESSGSTISASFNSADTNPIRLICVDHTGSVPPVSADLRTTATITTTGAAGITIGGSAYIYGITFSAGSTSSSVTFTIASIRFIRYENCALNFGSTASGTRLSTSAGAQVELHNTTIGFNATGQQFSMSSGMLKWTGSSSGLTGTAPTTLFGLTANRVAVIYCDGVDLSAMASKTLVGTQASSYMAQFLNCRLGSGTSLANQTAVGAALDIINSDHSTANYRNERAGWGGTLTTETTIAQTGGASDGTTGYSWKIVTNSNPKDITPFEIFPLNVWCDSTGSSKTITLEMVNDGVTLTNADIWAEARYLGSSSYPQASAVTSARADILASGTNLTSSSATWTTTGLASPVKQKIVLTFTPQLKGWVRVIVRVARTSTTLYLDPKPVLA